MKRSLFFVCLIMAGCAYLLRESVAAKNITFDQEGQRTRGRNGSPAYPERAKAPQEVLDRGKAVYGVNCAFCHGSDAAGGEVGPNLLRSSVVLEDQKGELIAPIVHGSRSDKGMPRIPIDDAQVEDIAAWLHSLRVASRTDPNAEKINILTGNAEAGKADFQRTCSSCHSVEKDLKGIGSAFPDPKVLQQTWMLPSSGGRGFGSAANQSPFLHVPPTSVIVTQKDGSRVEGKLSRIDDFSVSLIQPDGSYRTFERDGNQPKVEVVDPLAAHRKLLPLYKDKEIHDITAYLVTIR